jgi:ketosteroid isomerase-like protein
MTLKSLVATAALALLAGCSQQAAPADPAEVLAQIHKVEEAQVKAFAERDIDAGLAPYAETSAFAQGGAPYLDGLAAIRPAFEAMLADPAARLEMTSRGSFVASSGDLAVTTADYAFTYTDPETKQPVTEHGVNQTVWQRQEDGSWKNVSDFNVPTAPAEGAE